MFSVLHFSPKRLKKLEALTTIRAKHPPEQEQEVGHFEFSAHCRWFLICWADREKFTSCTVVRADGRRRSAVEDSGTRLTREEPLDQRWRAEPLTGLRLVHPQRSAHTIMNLQACTQHSAVTTSSLLAEESLWLTEIRLKVHPTKNTCQVSDRFFFNALFFIS